MLFSSWLLMVPPHAAPLCQVEDAFAPSRNASLCAAKEAAAKVSNSMGSLCEATGPDENARQFTGDGTPQAIISIY
jgi:hypothetical protein